MALYLFGPLIFSCFRVVRQKNPIPQSLLFHIHRFWNLRCPTYFEPKRHRVDFVALQLRSETIISSSPRYFPAGSCQIKWNKSLSVSLGRWQYYRLSFNILTGQMVTNLQFLWLLVLWHDLRHFDSPRIPLQPLASFQATVEHLASNHLIKTIHRIWPSWLCYLRYLSLTCTWKSWKLHDEAFLHNQSQPELCRERMSMVQVPFIIFERGKM